MPGKLSGIHIERAGNGFIIRQSKHEKSKLRSWTQHSTIHADHQSAVRKLAQLLEGWTPQED